MGYVYPLRFLYLPSKVLVEFTGLHRGTCLDVGSSTNTVGINISSWIAHTDPCWVPVEIPSTKRLIMAKLGGYRGL